MPPCRVQRRVDRYARQEQAVGICRGTLFEGAQTEIQDLKGWGLSGKRPDGQSEIGSLYQQTADWRVVQGAIREVKAEHTPPHAAKGK